MAAAPPKLSANFRKRATAAILSIALFVVVYLALLAGSLLLVYLAGLLALTVLSTKIHWLTVILALGVVASALLLVYFMIKFLFQRTESYVDTDVRVTEAEEPELFAMINEVVDKLDVKPPKKVFLTQEVNASVVYNSTFLSMFFPIRKNLRIGLGMMNALDREELRAVIAHEFGHFSQRSMAIGSYVYQVNFVLGNLLEDDASFNTAADRIASISSYVYPFVWVAMKIVQGARWLLTKIYGVVNLNYLSLSREMEYHADAVAASVGGGPSLATGLRRMNLAASSYNQALNFAARQIDEGHRVPNLYPLQSDILRYTATRDGLSTSNGLPIIEGGDYGRYLKSQIRTDDQWASHPETEDRIAHLELPDGATQRKPTASAVGLLASPTDRQRELTHKLLSTVQAYQGAPELDLAVALQTLQTQRIYGQLPEIYNGYLDHYTLLPPSTNQAPASAPEPPEVLFAQERVAEQDRLAVLRHDMRQLTLIKAGEIAVKTFDYAGTKYQLDDIEPLLLSVTTEYGKYRDKVAQNDYAITTSILAAANQAGELDELVAAWESFGKLDQNFDAYASIFSAVREKSAFINYDLPVVQINELMADYQGTIDQFKGCLPGLLDTDAFSNHISEEGKDALRLFLDQERKIFIYDSYSENGIKLLFDAVSHAEGSLSPGYWEVKRALFYRIADYLRTTPS